MRRRLAVALTMTVVAVALLLARRGGHGATATSVSIPPMTATTVTGHDAAGAEQVAVDWELRSAALIEGTDDDLAAAQRSIAADATREAQVTDSLDALHRLRTSLPAGLLDYRVAVLAAHTTAHTTDAVQVVIWRVGVITINGHGAAQTWATVTYELVWERNAWRILSETSTPGPVPNAPAPTPLVELNARLAALTEAGTP
jgi:hypothetical protein